MKREINKFRLFAIFPLVLGLALAACVPTSEHPVLVHGAPVNDPALMGTWDGFMDDDSDPATLYFIKAEEERDDIHPGGLDLIMISAPDKRQGPEGWAVLYALSAQINGNKFLSIEYRNEHGKEITGNERGYYLFLYEISGDDRLTVWGMDEDMLIEYIENQKIGGDVSKGRWFSDVRLTASSAELADFLKSVDVNELFSETIGPFTRRKHN